jgi:PAS domain S-box-containing protein
MTGRGVTHPAATVDLLPDGVLVVAPDGTIADANPAASALVGLPREALVGRLFDDALRLVDEAGRTWWSCERAARSRRSITRVPERRLSRSPDGLEVLLTARYVRSTGSGGALECVVVVLRDGSARNRLERRHSELVSIVAHELRSPLTSVKGFSATMLAKWDRFTDEQKRQMLEWIHNDADRVTRLLAELLDVSRIEAGRIELRMQIVDLPAVVERAFAGHIAAGESEDRFRLDVVGDLPQMWLDPDKIDQVVANLLENALRHGAGLVTVTISADTATPGAVIDVDDEGEGVPPEMADLVFSKFFRGRAQRGGTGLGLYIVRGLVEVHGGKVGVLSAPGGGARFRFRLPAGHPTYQS